MQQSRRSFILDYCALMRIGPQVADRFVPDPTTFLMHGHGDYANEWRLQVGRSSLLLSKAKPQFDL
jgi:hypothetical protein